MNTMVAINIVLLVLLVAVVKLTTHPKSKGWLGERMMAWMLRKLNPRQYQVLNNIYLPKADGTTSQIDHIVVSRFGVFVIETKTYKGWIFGDAKSRVWTQSICKKGFRTPIKNTFQNPIHQNYAHLCAIENCTGIPKSVMHPVIAFSGEGTFKTPRPEGVCYFGGVVEYIKSFTLPIIKEKQVDEIATAILDWQATLTKGQIAAHVDNLKKRHEGVSASDPAPKCPYCGAPTVRRVRKSDGNPFYGCSKYPVCKGIVNIRDLTPTC